MVKNIQDLVRPYVTVLFATATAGGWLMGRLSDDAFLGLAGMAIGFWFQQRQEKPSAPPEPPADH